MGKKRTTTNTTQNQTQNQSSTSSSTSGSSYNNSSNPWDPATGNLTSILGGSADAYARARASSGPNANMTLGSNSGADFARGQIGKMGQTSLGGMETVAGIAGNNIAGRGMFDPASLGSMYNFDDLKMDSLPSFGALHSFGDSGIADPRAVGGVVNAVAGARANYDPSSLLSNVANISALVPNYDQLFRNSVAGATAPIMTNFAESVIPAMLGRQATTGGTSSRHNIEATGLVDKLGQSIGDVVTGKGMELAGLQSGDFRTLAGIAGQDTTSIRGLESQDWRTLAGIGGDAFNTQQNLNLQYRLAEEQAKAGQVAQRERLVADDFGRRQTLGANYQTANQSARAGQAQGRDRIAADSYESGQQRTMTGEDLRFRAGSALPTMEAQWYENSLSPSRTLTGIGEQQYGWNQADIWNPLQQYSGLVNPIAALGGSSSGSQNQFANETGTSNSTSNMTGTQEQIQSGGTLGSIVKGLAGIAGMAAPFMGGGGGFGSMLSGLFGGGGSTAGQMANAFAGMPTMNITGIRRPQVNMGAMW